MAEWRLWRGWSSEELQWRLRRLADASPNFVAAEFDLTGEQGWQHYHSEAVIASEREGAALFERASVALSNYQFSDPAIVTAHFDPAQPLLGRRLLLEIKVLGLRYLCPAVVTHVRDEPGVYGFRYDTLEGHIERGIEWFVITRDETGDIRFRIEARWKHGQLPNWWSRLGFRVLSGFYQRHWHRQAHRRLSLLAWHGSLARPRRDAAGLTHQGVNVTFTYHTKTKVAGMKGRLLRDVLALGAITGVRSMAGPATLTIGHGVLPARIATVLAVAEMVVDKTPLVGARTDALPLAGRAVLGAIVGVLVAHERRGNRVLAGAMGAAASVAAAHLASRIRRQYPSANVAGGVIEDLIVMGVGAAYVTGRHS